MGKAPIVSVSAVRLRIPFSGIWVLAARVFMPGLGSEVGLKA